MPERKERKHEVDMTLPEREERKHEVDMTLPEKPACKIKTPDLELPKYKKPDYSHLLDL